MSDLRFALRSLRTTPGFTLAAVLALALGIGATTAVFSVVNGVLLRPLGYANPDRLVMVYATHPEQGPFYPPSIPDFEDWRAGSRDAFEELVVMRGDALLLRGKEGAQTLLAAHVSEGFFPMLGTRPALGRWFTADEERPGGPRVAVLKHGVWRSRFGGDPSVVGRTLDFAEGAYTVVGVMPPEFTAPEWGDIYVPLHTLPKARDALTKRDFRVDHVVIGRLRPGVTVQQATARLDAVSRGLQRAYPAENAGWSAQAYSLREQTVGSVRQSLLVLFGAVGVVLLIACADVANLLLVRATGRARELAVRAALGASRWRVARQLLAESLVIAVAGGALGLLLALWGVDLLKSGAPAGLPRVDEVGVDGGVLAFTAAVALLTALVFGVAPALQASRVQLADAMREGSKGAGRGAAQQRLRGGIVVTQIALALVLMVGAGLLMRSFSRLRDVNPGFDPAPLLTLRVEAPSRRYDTPEKLLALYRRLSDDVAAIPGVARVGFVNHLPLSGTSVVTPVETDQKQAPGEQNWALFRVADEHYFPALGRAPLEGRTFTAADMFAGSTAVVVNETVARRYWPNASAVGQRITVYRQVVGRPTYNQPVAGQVVGVVPNATVRDLTEEPQPEVYVPLPVDPWRSAFLTVRATRDPAELTAAVRRAVMAVDADIPVAKIETVSSLMATGLAGRRFNTTLLAAFAGAALLLAAIGIYGVMAYAVEQRTHEIGVRTALGAQRADVLRLIVGSGARLAAVGVVVGVAAAAASTRVLESMVYGVGVRDVGAFVGGALLLVAVALAACLLPARRATRVDPMTVLRSE
jgi:putative ABC transport system permease protein